MILRWGLALLGLVMAALIAAGWWYWTPDLPRAQLKADYLAGSATILMLDGTAVHLRDTGPREAQAVILIHGFGSSLHTWEAWARTLEAHHRVVRFDLPGSGLSPPDATGDYSDARSEALLLALMDRLGLKKAHLVGHSIGGRIAFTFAARHPERVRKLVLVAPDGFASPGFAYGKAPDVPAVLGLMRYWLPRWMLRSSLAAGFADPAALTEPLVTRYHDLMRAPGARQALLDRMRQTVLTDPAPLLRAIAAPVLLIWGEKDAMIPVANAADYQRLLPDATLVVLPEVGHVPQEEAPESAVGGMQAFLWR